MHAEHHQDATDMPYVSAVQPKNVVTGQDVSHPLDRACNATLGGQLQLCGASFVL
jgi:hypothetical protein